MSYVYILATVLLTVCGQVVVKWRVGIQGSLPDGGEAKALFLVRLLTDPWVLSGFLAAFCAALAWMAAISKLDLSYAYPFVALSFVLVTVTSALLFHEPITAPKVIGLALIVVGVIVSAQA